MYQGPGGVCLWTVVCLFLFNFFLFCPPEEPRFTPGTDAAGANLHHQDYLRPQHLVHGVGCLLRMSGNQAKPISCHMLWMWLPCSRLPFLPSSQFPVFPVRDVASEKLDFLLKILPVRTPEFFCFLLLFWSFFPPFGLFFICVGL